MPIKPFYSRRRSLGTALQPSSDMEDEVKAASRPRLASSTNRRPSLTQFLFGGKSSNNLLSANCHSRGASQISLSSIGSNTASSRLRRRSRQSIAVPIDSHRHHSFGSQTDSDEAFVDDDQVSQQQSLAESVEAFLALRRQNQSATKAQSKQQSKAVMRKVMRVVVLGGRKTGKTALLQQLACYNDITTQPYVSTIEDTYQIQTQLELHDSRPKEVIIFHDTAGINDFGGNEIRRPYLQVADAFILVYSVVDHESFNKMDILKRYIEKQYVKEKKDIPIVIVGTMNDLPGRKVDSEFANTWANKERVKLFELSATNRDRLVDIVHYLAGRYFHPIKESKFSLSVKRLRPEKSSSQQVLTDI
jgi:NF-kappa-B inhibitor-interacting Ras-like protein